MQTGADYPHLCKKCRDEIDAAALVLGLSKDDGPDTPDDDDEAACDYVYDHGLFCGGKTCENKPEAKRKMPEPPPRLPRWK